MREAGSGRAWRRLSEDAQDEARHLAAQGYAHPDKEITEAALRAVRRDYRRYVPFRAVALWFGRPVVGGFLLTMIYLGGRIDDAPWWTVVTVVSAMLLVVGDRAVRERGGVPPPIGSGVPFAATGVLAHRIGQHVPIPPDVRTRERLTVHARVVVGALVAVCAAVALLDRPADLRGGLFHLAGFGLLVSIGYLASWVAKWMGRRWRAWRGDRLTS